jgi:hypothetical protein
MDAIQPFFLSFLCEFSPNGLKKNLENFTKLLKPKNRGKKNNKMMTNASTS